MSKDEQQLSADDLPQKEAFITKEVYQHPQPADWGKPLNKDDKEDVNAFAQRKEQEKTSKEEGLNEAKSAGTAGAFEGFEDHQKNDV